MIPAPKLSPSEPVPFHEAIEWFQQQAPWISGSSWATMAGLAAYKGDQVSASILLSMVDDVFTQMDKAIVEGLPYGGFVRNMAEHLDAKWYAIDSPRLKLIYHNNVGNALMAGREAQLTDPDVMESMPFWLFDGIADFRQTVEICKPRDGIILPANDPWWKENTPLLHHGCRSGKVALDKEGAADLGGVTPVSKLALLQPAQKGWGKPASWIDWKPDPADYHPVLADEYQRWTSGQDYIHEKGEWDKKWQQVAAQNAFAKKAAEALAARTAKMQAYELELNDPTNNITWEKSSKYDGLKLNGVPIQPPVNGYWTGIKDVATGEPEIPKNLGKVSTGIIVMEDDGRIWVVEPKDHFGGYNHTFPKGKLEANLSAQQNALKELYEEAGLSAEITGYVGDFKGDTGVSRYYLAKRTGGQPWTAHWESQAVKLVTVNDVEPMLNKQRDKEILAVLMAKVAGTEPPQGLKTYVAPVKPVEAPKTDSSAIVAPVQSSDPFGLDPSKFVWHDHKPGGSSPGAIVAHPDAPGKTFLIKQLTDEFKAEAEITGCALYGLVNDDIVTVKMADSSKLPAGLKGRFVTIQQMEPGTVGLTSLIGSKSYPDFTQMTVGQQAELLAHGVASWIAGEHDGHAEQYLLKGDKLLRIDLGQSLKYTLTTGDKLDLNYHPNAAYGEARPLHLQLLKAIQDGKIDPWVLKHSKVLDAVNKAGTLTDAQIEKAVGKYGDLARGGKTKAEIVKLLKERAHNAKGDWADLFTKVQGKKFTWEDGVKVKEQPKPKKPRQARKKPSDEPANIAQGVSIPKIEKQLETFGAVTVAADGDKLRGQAWRVQRADRVDGSVSKPSFVFTGELDQSIWKSVSSTLKKNGAMQGEWETFPRVGMFKSGDTASSPVKKFDASKPSGFLGSSLVYRDANMKITWGDSSAHTAQKGQVKIEVFAADAKEAQERFKEALKIAGMDKHAMDKTPSADDAMIAKINRALWNIEGGYYKPITDLEDGKRRLADHKVEESQLSVVQNSLGYNEPRIDGRSEKYRQNGAKYLYHQFRPDEAPMRGISGADGGKGGIFSTVARSENGIVIGGMSSSTDLTTGGASSVFTRLVGSASSPAGRSWYSDYNCTAILSPKILDRTDFYGYKYDNYGRTTGDGFTNRDGANTLVRDIVSNGSSSNELMFRNVVDREDILFFAVTDESKRASALGILTNSGVKTIRGQPVEEMVVVMTTPSDFSRLNSKNPVHAFLMGKKESYPEWTETYGGTK